MKQGDKITMYFDCLGLTSKEQVTITDRFFSGFLGSGFDYQISKRFKLNMNYKANISSNPEIPILSFFLIGSKVNL